MLFHAMFSLQIYLKTEIQYYLTVVSDEMDSYCANPIYLCLLLHFSSLVGHPLMPDFFLDVETDTTSTKQERYGRKSTVCASP